MSTLCEPWTVACQAPLSVGFSGLGYWSGLPCPPPGGLSDPGTEPVPPASPALAVGFFTADPPGKSVQCSIVFYNPQCFFKKILSIIYIYIFYLFQILSFIGYFKILSIFPCAIQ